MHALTKCLAGATVATGMLLTPIFSRLSGVPERDAPLVAASVEAVARPLPAGWPVLVSRELARAPLPVERTDLDSMLRIVDRAARRFRVDPLTVIAVIKVESGFNPFAVSSAGAIGLMQVRAETGREVAARVGVEWTNDDLLFDPEVNVVLGTAYLRELLDRFDNLDVALAAFHAGPNKIAARNLELGDVSLEYTGRVWEALLALHKTARV